MRRAAARVAEGYSEVGAGGTHQARLERDAADALTRRRLAALDIGEAPLCFGRLDLRSGIGDDEGPAESLPAPGANGSVGAPAAPGERRFYVGVTSSPGPGTAAS